MLLTYLGISLAANHIEDWDTESEREIKKTRRAYNVATFKKYFTPISSIMLVLMLINTLLPKKEYIPLIFFSKDIATEFNASINSGKLAKLSEIIDLKLESTIEELTQNKEK